MSEDLELPYLRAKQKVRSRTVAGVLATCLTAALGVIVNLVREMRADAEKQVLAAQSTAPDTRIDGVRQEIFLMRQSIDRDLSDIKERLARVEERTSKK